jgi:uncharacterized protein HemY
MKDKKKKILSLILCAVMAIMAGAVLTSCGSNPADAADQYLKAIKSQDDKTLSDQIEKSFSTIKMNGEQKKVVTNFIKKLCDFDYKVGEAKQDGDNATVDVTFTTYDWKTWYQNIIKDAQDKALEMAKEGKITADNATEEATKLIIDDIDKDLGKLKTKSINSNATLKLKKKDGKWTVQSPDSDCLNAMMGNLTKAVS